MKKKLIYIMLFIFIFLPTFARANTYNHIKFNSSFVTKANVSRIAKFYIKYKTYKNGVATTNTIYLSKNDNFKSLVDLDTPVDDAKMVYGIAITDDEVLDSFGFIKFKSETSYNNETHTINIYITVDYYNKAFDGENYREYIDYSDKELEDRINGVRPTEDPNNKTTTKTTKKRTTTTTNSSGNGDSTTTSYDYITQEYEDSDSEKIEKDVVMEKRVVNALMIAGFVILGLLIILVIYTIVKINDVKKRV